MGNGLDSWIQPSYLDWKLQCVIFLTAEGSAMRSYQLNLSSQSEESKLQAGHDISPEFSAVSPLKSQPSRGRGKWVPVSLGLTWSTECISGQPGLYTESLLK